MNQTLTATRGARKATPLAVRAVIGAFASLALLVASQPGFGTAPNTAFAGKGPTKVDSTARTTTTTETTTTGTTVAGPADAAPMALVTESTGARAYWKAGFTGKGIDIAIIDSGIAPVNGLSASGKVILGPDLSFESQDPATRYLDTNGHGTHLAGIVAGRDSSVTKNYAGNTAAFLGMAPDARLVSIKVADSVGRTDVSQVIAGIDWVVQHKNDNGMNIRVLLLAFGTDSTAPWYHDPLVQAAEVAWKNGIFVVISAGNDGEGAKWTGSLSNPARSPNLMTVGATDTVATSSLGDDTVPNFSSSGNAVRRVDAVAPGAHIVSLKAPGSYAATNFAATGNVGDRFFRGSGTSQAAAVVAGSAALIIQQRPTISPQELKNLLASSATVLMNESPEVQGPGELNLAKALNLATPTWAPSVGGIVWSDGMGSLESARGTRHLVHNGVTLSGDIDIFGHSYDSKEMAALTANASSWSGGTWNGNGWTASSWSASGWSASSWVSE